MGIQKLLDPNGTKRRQFNRIIEIVAQARRPKTDYKWLSHIDFLRLQFLRRILEIQTSYMILLRSFAKLYERRYVATPILSKGYLSVTEILEWSRTVETKELYEAFCSYPHRGLIVLMTDLKLEQPYIEHEFAARVADKPFTSEFILVDWGGLDRQAEVEKLLQVNKMKSFRPSKYSSDDLKQAAWEKALELWHKPGAELWRPESGSHGEVITPLPEFPGAPYIKMLPAEKEFWEGPMARAWRDGKVVYLREGVPMLAGEKEGIPERVRENRRNEWETISRQKKILDDPAAQDETRRLIHERTDRDPDVSSRMLDVLRIAKKRWGAKAVTALELYSQGKTEGEAAQLAGISTRTVQNYISKLKKEFSKKE